MLLKLLAPLRTDFAIVTEYPMLDAEDYANFWDFTNDRLQTSQPKVNNPSVWSSSMNEFRFAHVRKFHKSLKGGSAYRTLDNDALPRPLQIMEIHLTRHHIDLQIDEIDDDNKESIQEMLNTLTQVVIRVFDQHISLVEIDLALGDRLQKIHPDRITDELDTLGNTAVDFGEELCHWLNQTILKPLFAWLVEPPQAKAYIDMTPSPIIESEVMWVTRTLIFEEDEPKNRDVIIQHWLKDSGGHDAVETYNGNDNEDLDTRTYIERAQQESDAHVARWLNYLFRENSYRAISRNKLKDDHSLMPPISDEWSGLLYAQYYYAALDVVDRHLTTILAKAWVPSQTIKVNSLKDTLEYNIRNANLLLLQRQDNNKYYRRAVKAELEMILGYWEFEEVLVEPVQNKIALCEARLSLLLQQEASKSAIFTDMILLGIGITSIFSTFLGLAEFGRTMATDVSLASYDVNSPNLIEWLAIQPTDVILVLSLMLSAILAILYLFFRQRQMVS